MCFTPFPPGTRSGSPSPPPALAKDIAMEDWDLLFDAVILRLLTSFDDVPPDNASPRRVAWEQTRARVMDCVQALDQLHMAAVHELARPPRAAPDSQPWKIASQVSEAPAKLCPMHDDMLLAVWRVWNDTSMPARGGQPLTAP